MEAKKWHWNFDVYDESGHEVLHTGNRNVNTEVELNELLEGMPDFVEIMADIVLDDEVE